MSAKIKCATCDRLIWNWGYTEPTQCEKCEHDDVPMFKVLDKTFATFDEVVQWAWDTYKLDANPDIEPHKYKQACSELEEIVAEIERETSTNYRPQGS